MNWVSILGKISIWIILLPLLIGLFKLGKLNRDSKLILLIVLIGTVPQVLNPFIRNSESLIFLYNVYTPLEFGVYWILFRKWVSNKKLSPLYNIILLVFCGISIYIIANKNLFSVFITEWVIVNNIFQLFLICLCLLNFYQEDRLDFFRTGPFFWYLTGIIVYASCTVVFYSLWDYVKRQGEQIIVLNVIHHVANIFLYLTFSLGLLLDKDRTYE